MGNRDGHIESLEEIRDTGEGSMGTEAGTTGTGTQTRGTEEAMTGGRGAKTAAMTVLTTAIEKRGLQLKMEEIQGACCDVIQST